LQLRSQPESAADFHMALANCLSRQPDVGLGKFLLDWALDPPSPFDPHGRRRLKRGFVLVVLAAAGIAETFVYFNFF